MISAPRPARASAIASSLGIVYCTPRRTPGTRRTASEWPCERPLPQNVFCCGCGNSAAPSTRFTENRPGSQPVEIIATCPPSRAAASISERCRGMSWWLS